MYSQTRSIALITPLLLLVCLLFIMHVPTGAQEEQGEAPALRFSFDANRFRYSDSLVYLEYTASLFRNELTFVPLEDKYRGEFLVNTKLIQEDSVIASKIWSNTNTVDSLSEISDTHRLFCLNNFVVGDGKYNFTIKVTDVNSEKSAEFTVPVDIQVFEKENLAISDIQLASKIEKDDSKSIFTKNGFRVYPNPSRLYGIGLPILYCYAELYNLTPATTDSGSQYQVDYSVYNSDGQLIKTYPSKIRKKPGTSSVEVNGVNVVTLVSGPYFLQLEVTDFETGDKTRSQQKFFVYRQDDFKEGGAAYQKKEIVEGVGSPGVDAERYTTMTEKELDQEFDYARYISKSEERKTYNKLNLEGKRNYIKEFWAQRDPTPGTPANEYKRDYLERVQIADNSYRGTFREGWRTDRGRVLLVYGRPDEIERFPFSNENKAYEIWHFYSIQGGVVFIFVDRQDMGDLELVHSSARGELYDNDWTRWINPSR